MCVDPTSFELPSRVPSDTLKEDRDLEGCIGDGGVQGVQGQEGRDDDHHHHHIDDTEIFGREQEPLLDTSPTLPSSTTLPSSATILADIFETPLLTPSSCSHRSLDDYPILTTPHFHAGRTRVTTAGSISSNSQSDRNSLSSCYSYSSNTSASAPASTSANNKQQHHHHRKDDIFVSVSDKQTLAPSFNSNTSEIALRNWESTSQDTYMGGQETPANKNNEETIAQPPVVPPPPPPDNNKYSLATTINTFGPSRLSLHSSEQRNMTFRNTRKGADWFADSGECVCSSSLNKRILALHE